MLQDYAKIIRYCSHASLQTSASASNVTRKGSLECSLPYLLVNDFPRIPYLPLASVSTREILYSKGHFTSLASLKTIVYESMKNRHESVAFILLPDVLQQFDHRRMVTSCNNLSTVFVILSRAFYDLYVKSNISATISANCL